jgi:hypothetical protein
MASTPLSARIEGFEQTLKSLANEVAGDEASRKKLLAIVKEQNMILESPVEMIWRMIMEVRSTTFRHQPYTDKLRSTATSTRIPQDCH